MNILLDVKKLTKSYETFAVKNISFQLEKGYIMGFIGANGAGKTTTLKSILNYIKPDSGEVSIFGKDYYQNELELKQSIGFMLGGVDYYLTKKVKNVVSVYKRFFNEWSDTTYRALMKKFKLDETKKIKEYSAGMRVKLGITLALSHNAKLLIFDEPTSGLDPLSRDELLDIFKSIIESGERSILFSTHITSDLDKCADYILFISDGKIIANSTKDEILESHLVIKGNCENLTESLAKRMVGYKVNSFSFTGLIKKDALLKDDVVVSERPNLEDIMIYYNKEHAHEYNQNHEKFTI